MFFVLVRKPIKPNISKDFITICITVQHYLEK